MSFFGAIGGFIMTPLYYVISIIMVGFHKLFSTFLDPSSGAAWALSIVGLTIVIRALLIPLFVKQIKASRNMQLLQPQVKELQKKYGHDREKLTQETMKLYREAGTNPFASCLPILLQMPIFLALFRMPDATVFSIDVAATKARNVVYFSSNRLDPRDLPGRRAPALERGRL